MTLLTYDKLKSVSADKFLVGIKCCSVIIVLLCLNNSQENNIETGSFHDSKSSLDLHDCGSLLSDGRLVRQGGLEFWQPSDCRMKYYNKSDLYKCFTTQRRFRHVAFMGDSRVRFPYLTLVNMLTGIPQPTRAIHNNLYKYIKECDLHLDFYWAPLVNEKQEAVYQRWLKRADGEKDTEDRVTDIADGETDSANGETDSADGEPESAVREAKIVDGKTSNADGETGSAFGEKFSADVKAFTVDTAVPIKETLPDLIVNGGAVWTMKEFGGKQGAVNDYKSHLTSLLPLLRDIKENHTSTRIIWMLQERFDEQKSQQHGKSFAKNVLQEQFNAITMALLPDVGVDVWKALTAIQGYYKDSTADGIHIYHNILEMDMQMLINYICNVELIPQEGLCCQNQNKSTDVPQKISPLLQRPTHGQKAVFIFTGICSIATIGLFLIKFLARTKDSKPKVIADQSNRALLDLEQNHVKAATTNKRDTDPDMNGWSCFRYEDIVDHNHVFLCLTKLGFILSLFILCDRQDALQTLHINFSLTVFLLAVVVLLVVGLACSSTTSKQTTVLHDDQLEEWKGWMVLVVLVYNVTGASQHISIYVWYLVIISAFLFLAAYIHFMKYVKEAEYSLKHMAQVLLRYNLFAVLLCICTESHYMTYSLVPLLSFWFIVTSLFVLMWPRISLVSLEFQGYWMLQILMKLVILVVVITILFFWKGLFHLLFGTWLFSKHSISSHGIDAIHEWRHYWLTDRYSTLYGILCALLVLYFRHKKYFDESASKNLFSFSTYIFSTGVVIFCLIDYIILKSKCYERSVCDEMHAYISAAPILSYVFLRNVNGFIRQRYSLFFSFFGTFYLELLVVQYHLWSSDATYKFLVLIPSLTWFNVIVTSFVCVMVAHEFYQITHTLSGFIVPNGWMQCFKNLLILLIILLSCVLISLLWIL